MIIIENALKVILCSIESILDMIPCTDVISCSSNISLLLLTPSGLRTCPPLSTDPIQSAIRQWTGKGELKH